MHQQPQNPDVLKQLLAKAKDAVQRCADTSTSDNSRQYWEELLNDIKEVLK